jgi:glycerol kinase
VSNHEPAAENVLAIDQGTSGTKALVVSALGDVLASAEVPVRPRYGAGGSVEQDPLELLDSVVTAGNLALSRSPEPVAAIGLANQGETVLAWNLDTGVPQADALVWQDRRAQGICDELADHAVGFAELTGLSLDPYFAAPKMAWLRRNEVAAGDRNVVTTSDAWLLRRLTGAFVTDASTASRTLLMDLETTAWSARALELFGLDGELMPDIVDSAGPVGTTRMFDTDGDVPVTGVLVDQQAALLGERCIESGNAKCTYGTGAFLLANIGPVPRRSSTGLATSVAWRFGGRPAYCLDGQVYTVASAVRWLADMGIIGDVEDLDRVAETVAGTEGVTLVPAFSGLAAPWWRGDVGATISGLGLGTGPGHVVRALCEGVAAQVALLAGAIATDLGSPLVTLRVDGGLTRSRTLMQAQADLLQMPVEVFASPDATAFGVAVAARLGLRPAETLDALGGTGGQAGGKDGGDDANLGADLARALGAATASSAGPALVYEPGIGPDEAAERLHRHSVAVASMIERQEPSG